MFFIRIKIKGYLENKSENTKEIIDTFGIINKNNLSYIYNDTKHKITFNDNKVILIRENKEFIHNFIFELNKETKSEYYIKEFSTSINVWIITTNLLKTDNKLEISYKIIDSSDEYNYVLDLE